MKQFLIPDGGQFYKANLHCHTTCSDGVMTPLEVKDYYKARGYSIVAFTDHCVLIPHPELADANFLPLNGYESEQVAADTEPVSRRKHCHICFIALKKDNITMPYYNLKAIWGQGRKLVDQVKFNMDHTLEHWEHDPEITNQIIRLGREAGFFVTYNHPAWSTEHYEDYSRYTGMCAMEIMNYSSWITGYGDYNPRIYDELLRKGERIYAIAADDNHNAETVCGGWTMIKADQLEYETITAALEQGHFYASFGPEIHGLWFEDGKVQIRTGPAKRIICSFRDRRATIRNADQTPLTQAEFEILPSDGYFRITVVDEQGRCANTNAYFTDTLFPDV